MNDYVLTYITLHHPMGPVPTELSWSVHDPYDVVVTFYAGVGQPNEWHISRDLLFLGLAHKDGDGDVRLERVTPREFELVLDSPSGYCELVGQVSDLASFLYRTEQIVPRGSETVDVDAWITSVLEAELA